MTKASRFPNSPLRVCFLLESFYPVVGGMEASARTLAEDLMSRGAKVVVVTRRTDGTLKKREEIGKVTVHRIPPVGVGRFKRWGMVFSCLPTLLKLRQEYDIVFVQGFRSLGISAVLMSKLLRKSCVLKADSNGEMSGEFFAGGLKRFHLTPSSLGVSTLLSVRNRILQSANSFISVSSDITTELMDNRVSPDKIQVVPNSIDLRQFHPVTDLEKAELRRRLGLPQCNKIVTFTGRLVSYKGLPLLVRVWKEIYRKHPDSLLLLVGSGGMDIHNCESELKDYVKSNCLEGAVRFMGNIQNVHEYLQASDIFCFPTEDEAFGISLIEAMACGLPVISTKVGGIKDILTHRKDGMVVKAGDFQQLEETLHTLITDSSLAASLGRAGLETARSRYSREIIVENYISVFSSVQAGYRN